MCRSSIVGTYYRSQYEKSCLYNANNGDQVRLVRDKKNEFDGSAVAIFIGRTQVGWMSRSDASLYGKVMDAMGADTVTGYLAEVFEKYPTFTFELDRDAVERVEKQLLKDQFG